MLVSGKLSGCFGLWLSSVRIVLLDFGLSYTVVGSKKEASMAAVGRVKDVTLFSALVRSELPFCRPPFSGTIQFLQHHSTSWVALKRMFFCMFLPIERYIDNIVSVHVGIPSLFQKTVFISKTTQKLARLFIYNFTKFDWKSKLNFLQSNLIFYLFLDCEGESKRNETKVKLSL